MSESLQSAVPSTWGFRVMPVRRRQLISRISPTIDLNEIIIRLGPQGVLPMVELRGRISSQDRRHSQASSAKIETMVLTQEGRQFVAQMLDAFGRKTSASEDFTP